ncbi:hypothetical protein [Sphingobium agri]|uniref:Uncharacterized protein n=1 Tax=Sphingobium agri TaxID=2933566 RepID=A0ABT0DXF2_9SPHN|nr:hypothetical protein [Sphingobium agri]MCK0531788.1 hypothetical protein [Sphingobium agri]
MDQIEIARRGRDPVLREYNAMMKQIQRGDPMHPREVEDMINDLVAEGYNTQAAALARANVNWDQ